MKRSARSQFTQIVAERSRRRGIRCDWTLSAYGRWWVPSLGRWSEYPAPGGPRGTLSYFTRALRTRAAALNAAASVAALGCGGRLQRSTYNRGVLTCVDYEIKPR